MAKKVIWSLDALDNIDSISEYISKDSKFYAASFVQEIIEKSRTLTTLEFRGRIVPELRNENIREIFIKEFRLIYEIKSDRIIILNVIRGRRDIHKTMEKYKP